MLLQICAAPGRELSYALYRLNADMEAPERIAFDDTLFDPVRAARGELHRLQPLLDVGARAALLELIRDSVSGQELIQRGYPGDIAVATALNASATTPMLVDGAYCD